MGLLESLSSTAKPIGLISIIKEILEPGKFNDGKNSVPFEFKLAPSGPRQLVDTYHGVYICVQYMLAVEVQRGSLFGQGMTESTEFIVEVPVIPHALHAATHHTIFRSGPQLSARTKGAVRTHTRSPSPPLAQRHGSPEQGFDMRV